MLFSLHFGKGPPPCVKRRYVSRPRVPASSKTRVFMLCDRRPDSDGLGGTQVHAAALVKGAASRVELFAAYPAEQKLVVLRPGSTRDPLAELADR